MLFRSEVDVLDRVLSAPLFEDDVRRDALRDSQELHAVGFDEAIVCGAAGHDDMRSDAALILADGLENSLALLGGWSVIGTAGRAEDNEGVEVGKSGVGGGDGAVVECWPKCEERG